MTAPDFEPVRVGVVGAGNISNVYLSGLSRSPAIDLRAVASHGGISAQSAATAHGANAARVADLLADPAIELVVNLTPGKVHEEINGAILHAGKHIYSEKPLALSGSAAGRLSAMAQQNGLLIGSAPDTFFGAAHQAARKALDQGMIGKPVLGMSFLGLPGLEMFHPNPAAFYQPGGEPPFDAGPYYIAMWIHLLGPVRQVFSASSAGKRERRIIRGPMAGTTFPVEVDSTFNTILDFETASVSFVISLDVVAPSHRPGELYGSDGALFLGEPLFFGGDPQLQLPGRERESLPVEGLPFSRCNTRGHTGQPAADYRGVGVIDLAVAIRTGKPHRTAPDFVVHCVDVMEAITRSAREGRPVRPTTTCQRPPLLDPQADAQLIGLMRSPFDDFADRPASPAV